MQFPTSLRDFLTPPELPDPSESIRAANIHYVALAILCLNVVGFTTVTSLVGFLPVVFANAVSMLVASCACLALVRRRRLALAGWGFASLLWLSTTMTVMNLSSLIGTAYGSYIGVVIIAGVLAGTRGAAAAAAASAGVSVWMAMRFGDAALSPPTIPITIAVYSLYFFVMVGVVAIVNRGITTSLRRLEDSTERFRVLTEGTRDLVSEFDRSGQLVYASPNHLEVLGHTPDALVARSVFELAHPDDRRTMEGSDWASASPREQIPVRYQHADGSWRHLEVDIRDIRSHDGDPMTMAISRDVTARLDLEQQLQQSQRLESVGRLAGGVAHDFNNLLTVIRGYAEFLQERSPGEEIEEIDRAADRAAGLIRQLLAFSRRQTLTPEIIDLNDVIADIEPMLLRLINEDIELTTSLCGDGSPLLADPSQLEQVIVNLVVNARDAMPDGGMLHIETRVAPGDRAENTPNTDDVVLRVTDTGEGIDEATMALIFEPFFTTKGEGFGTGLGLSTVHGIVSQSGGTIAVDSKPGAGTTFEVRFPRSHEVRQSSTEPSATSCPASPNGARILLVEDNEALCRLCSRTLRAEGCQVFEANNGVDALALAHAVEFDLLVTDVVMPQMGGAELRERLRADHAHLPVLFMSGYAETEAGSEFSIAADDFILHKPFLPADLVSRVSELVAAPVT